MLSRTRRPCRAYAGRPPGTGRDGEVRQVPRDHRVGAHNNVAADRDAVEHRHACPDPAVRSDRNATRRSRLLDDRHVGPRDIVSAAHDVRIRRHEGIASAPDVARGKDRAEGADIDTVLEHDVAVLRVDAGVTTDEHAVADRDAGVRRAFASSTHPSSMTTSLPIRILCGWRNVTSAPKNTLRPHAPSSHGYRRARSSSPSAPGMRPAIMITASCRTSAAQPGRPTTRS